MRWYLHAFEMPPPGCQVQRGVLGFVQGVDVGAGVQEQLHEGRKRQVSSRQLIDKSTEHSSICSAHLCDRNRLVRVSLVKWVLAVRRVVGHPLRLWVGSVLQQQLHIIKALSKRKRASFQKAGNIYVPSQRPRKRLGAGLQPPRGASRRTRSSGWGWLRFPEGSTCKFKTVSTEPLSTCLAQGRAGLTSSVGFFGLTRAHAILLSVKSEGKAQYSGVSLCSEYFEFTPAPFLISSYKQSRKRGAAQALGRV